MENITVKDFVNVLCLRNQLVNVDLDQLLEVYEDYENYVAFLDSVAVLSEIDSAFLLFDDKFINKIYSIIQIHRFDAPDKEVKDAVNEIIGYLNNMRAYKPEKKKILKDAYFNYNEEVRNTYIPDQDNLIYCLGYDAVVYAGITEGNMDIITEDDMFLASINYFIETIPSIFENKEVRDRTMKLINKIGRNLNPFKHDLRKYSVETKDSFQKIKTKEE